jgi:hypothetical protein
LKYLVVKGMHGWGDRIFALAEAVKYCKETGRTLVIDFRRDTVYSNYYKDGIDKNVFDLYFEIDDFDHLSSLPPVHGETYTPNFWDEENIYQHPGELKDYYEEFFKEHLANYKWGVEHSGYFDWRRCFVKLYNDKDEIINYDEDVVLFMDSNLRNTLYDDCGNNKTIKDFKLKIKRNVLDIVDKFCEKHDIRNIVGIHGRYSPCFSFQTGHLRFPAKGLLDVRKLYKGKKVFLATDSHKIKETIKSFADVIDYKKHVKLSDIMAWDEMPFLNSVRYVDREKSGLEALVDALILSRCKEFVPLNKISLYAKLVKIFRVKGL